MSAIAGVVRFDGAPCTTEPLAALARLLAHRSHDGTSTWLDGAAGFVYGRVITTPESATEVQPFADAARQAAIVFDGRLDNRDQLSGLAGIESADAGDAEIVLRTYAAHGPDALTHLLGDFAFAIWDGRSRRLFCARDPFGVKPFCYRATAHQFAFASEPGALARFAGTAPAINEAMIAEHLAGIVTSRTDTLYTGILRLPAAHYLIADARGTRVAQYWTPDLTAELHLPSSAAYAEQLHDLVERAVAARLRVRGGVAVSLSGGVDSSAIAGVAASLCRQRAVPATHVSALTLVGDGIDETVYSKQVVERWGIDATTLPVSPLPPGALAAEAQRHADVPNTPNSAYTDRLRRCARRANQHVMLNGGGADDWFGVSARAYADLLGRGHIAPLARRLRFDAREQEFVGWRSAAKAAVWPLLPRTAQHLVRRVVRWRAPSWLDPSFVARVHLRDRLGQHVLDLPYTSHERYDNWHQAYSGVFVDSYERFERSSATTGVDTWFPFFDRRIIEFGLAVPANQRWRDGRAKDVLRRAMARYLPPSIAERRTNPSGTHLLLRGIESEGGRALFERMTIADLGWVNQSAVLEHFDAAVSLHAAGDCRYHWQTITLWHIAAIELWARAMRQELCLNN